MTAGVLSQILDGQKGVRKDGSAYVLDENIHATAFVGAGGGELMSVVRIVRMDLGKEIIALATAKHERFFFPYDMILGLKLEESQEKKAPGGAGFR